MLFISMPQAHIQRVATSTITRAATTYSAVRHPAKPLPPASKMQLALKINIPASRDMRKSLAACIDGFHSGLFAYDRAAQTVAGEKPQFQPYRSRSCRVSMSSLSYWVASEITNVDAREKVTLRRPYRPIKIPVTKPGTYMSESEVRWRRLRIAIRTRLVPL